MNRKFGRLIVYSALTGIAALFLSSAVIAQPPQGAPGGPPPGDPYGPDMYIAIRTNRIDQLEELLNKGAKTEERNWLGVTPLLWASIKGNEKACLTLLEHKADLNCDSIYGGTLEFAAMSGNPKVVKLLLDRGVKTSAKRSDQITPLMIAADMGNVEIMRMLLQQKPDVNAVNAAGVTALTQASRRGQLVAARLLLDAGADANLADKEGRTPIMYAAMNAHPEVVKLLASRGAKINARDKAGETALLLVARFNGDAATTAALLKAGADASTKDKSGRSISAIARKHGFQECVMALDPKARTTSEPGGGPISARARQAALLSLPLIERTTQSFTEHSGCTSCHHQGLGLIATGTARSLGFPFDKKLAEDEQKLVLSEGVARLDGLRQLVPHPDQYKHFVAVDIDDLSPVFGASLSGLGTHAVPSNEVIEIFTTLLARQQAADGSWGFGINREPIESSPFTSTAYALRVLNTYAPPSLEAERKDRVQKALAWLVATPAQTTEDRAFRLMGLKWAGAPKSEIEKAKADLKRTQRRDGGWAQFQSATYAGPGYTRSDAYATGESLYALHIGGGVKTTDPVYQSGVKYLLNTQQEDGSWFVNKRAIPANNYFETGFPHGESQFISYGATCWAAMALMFAATSPGT
jgi:ankyrin repeat protein